MSVRLPDRKPSEADFINNALKLRKEMTELLLRDFGVKSKIRDRVKDARMDEASADKLKEIATKYNMADEDTADIENVIHNCTYDERELLKYPDWLVNHFRESILHSLDNLIDHLYQGNGHFISEKAPDEEYKARRLHWNEARGELKNLAAKLDYVRLTLPVDANKYDRYLTRIVRELKMLKALKTADNGVLSKILKRMAGRK